MFSAAIEQAIASARVVVVLWSPDAAESHWVQSEAAEGLARGILVPALIEDCSIPLEFRRIEAAQIGRRWSDSEFEYQALMQAVATKLNDATAPPLPPPPHPVRWWERFARNRAAAVASAGAIGVLALVGIAAMLTNDGNTTTTIATTGVTSTTAIAGSTSSTAASSTTSPTSTSSSTSTSSTAPVRPLDALARHPITEQGIGPLAIGMRADQIRDALPEGVTVAAYDQQGPLVDTEGVTITDETGEPVMFALALPGEGPGLGLFVFIDEAFATAEGVGPGTSVADATLPYGFATLSFSYENEGREFVDFEYIPYADVAFRVDSSPGEFGGIYPEDVGSYATTTEYRPDATIGSVWVICRIDCEYTP